MRDPTALTYEMTRRYVSDSQALTTEEKQKIQGWIRSRSLPKLATACTQIGSVQTNTDRQRCLMQIEAFFKKNEGFCDSKESERTALDSFWEAEKVCAETNQRLESDSEHGVNLHPDFASKIKRMSQWIDRVLGSFDDFLEHLPELVRVTAGATATTARKESRPHMKLLFRVAATPSAEPYLRALYRYFGSSLRNVDYTCTNRVEVVPKNWKTGRTIACEPAGNIPLQLAFDSYVKDRLRIKTKIDLSDQTENAKRARIGSIDGSYATIDLSAASDTVAYNTVASLFPMPWFKYLCDVRSPLVKLSDERIVKYEKFSSMGNGSTFTIETLVFAAAAYAVGSREPLVYGDDIVIENDLGEPLAELLQYLLL